MLSVHDPNQVSSARTLDVFLGEPPRHMIIFTGIAIPRLPSDDDDDPAPVTHETVIIKLGRSVAQPPRDDEWTATVGLTNLSNTESDLIFALDNVTALQVDEKGELELVVDLGVQGDDSVLNSFSYQVTVLVVPREVGLKSIQVSDNIPLGGIGDPNDPNPPPGSTQLQWGPSANIVPHATWRVRVELDGPAPDPGVVVKIMSSSSIVPVPQPSLLVQPGKTMSDEPLSPPTGNLIDNNTLTATITASYLGRTRTALINVKGPPK